MRKRYCVNADQCVVLPTIVPLFWTAVLLALFLFMLWAEGSKDITAFWEARTSGWRLWFYLSGPISLVISIPISAIFIVFPVSYVELGETSLRVHRAFKKDRSVRYDAILYIRFHPKRGPDWWKVHFVLADGAEFNTIEIRKDYPFPSFWLSASRHAYDAITKKIKSACHGQKELVEGNGFVAESLWITEHGNPQEREW
ncbi:MAG: hypothetical protein K6E59_05390 [Bacilli bacterium]|nr:hypothetical protein [Bacilli bacterium]